MTVYSLLAGLAVDFARRSDRAVETALRLLAFDPLQENVHRALMSLYARQGRQASALRQFQLCRDVLRRELDVAPEPETERLFREVQEKRRRKVEPAAWPLSPDREARAPEPEGFPFGEAADAAPVAELRQVTVLCAELAEPAGGMEADPEETQLRADRFVALTRNVVAACGGTVETYVGGGVVAFFGMPVAHGNDAERAARAVFRIRSDWTSQADGDGADIRIGIADGRMLVTRGAAGNGR